MTRRLDPAARLAARRATWTAIVRELEAAGREPLNDEQRAFLAVALATATDAVNATRACIRRHRTVLRLPETWVAGLDKRHDRCRLACYGVATTSTTSTPMPAGIRRALQLFERLDAARVALAAYRAER